MPRPLKWGLLGILKFQLEGDHWPLFFSNFSLSSYEIPQPKRYWYIHKKRSTPWYLFTLQRLCYATSYLRLWLSKKASWQFMRNFFAPMTKTNHVHGWPKDSSPMPLWSILWNIVRDLWIPYARHYNPRFVFFYPIFHCGLYCSKIK